MLFPTRKAALAAAAALCIAFPFALAACGGGGAPAKPTAMPDPAPTPPPAERPDAGNPSSFFPINSQHVVRPYANRMEHGFLRFGPSELTTSAGTTFANLLPNELTSRNFPQFSQFSFGSAGNDNGIPMQTATATQADRYAAIAYQAVLEHSMLIVQGGVYSYATGDPSGTDVTGGRLGTVGLSIGSPTTGEPVAGTWTGKAIGFEVAGPTVPTPTVATESVPTYPINAAEAEKHVVTGDVNISVALEGTTRGVSFTLGNWQGGSGAYDDITSDNLSLLNIDDPTPHFLRYGPGTSDDSVNIQFYGPNRQEAGGTFGMSSVFGNHRVYGGFAARKQ